MHYTHYFRILGLLLFVILNPEIQAQPKSDSSKSISGWTFGGLPVLAFNADFGLKYGAIANFYYYGDEGIRYPYYDHSLFTQVTNTTNDELELKVRYDGRQLISEGRFLIEIQQLSTLYRPFYGFNGYEALYNDGFIDAASDSYISPLYYYFQQKSLNVFARVDKNLRGRQLRVQGQLKFTNLNIESPSLQKYNQRKEPIDQAPDTTSLYDNYVNWGVINSHDKSGGTYMQIAIGGVIDTRNIEPWPSKGLWEELSINYTVPLDGAVRQAISLRATHRHYQTILADRLVFAHRVQYQTFLSDDVPFYMLQMLGGQDNLRGMKFSRLMGLGVAGANVELRWKVLKWVIFNQHIYGGINLFYDTGIVTKKFVFDDSNVPTQYLGTLNDANEAFHNTAGLGVKGALNENFVLAIDYGRALDSRDGDSGVYITLGWLF